MDLQGFSKTVENRFVSRDMLKSESVEEREYQNRILETARQRNTLIVLPTALGKTVIALLLALERIDKGRIFILAPTRPLVQQHTETFCRKTLIEKEKLVLVTGKSPPTKRKVLYKAGEIIFSTPQCVRNDLEKNLLVLDDVSLMVFDEAHRAKGKYAYVGIANHYFGQCLEPLVLGLTASPGGHEEKITEICRNLGIQAIEYRTDEDEDVKPYIQPIEVTWRRVKLPKAYIQVRDKLKEIIVERIKSLQSLGALSKKRATLVTRRDLVELNEELQRRLKSGEGGYLYGLKIRLTAALSIMHMIELIETQGAKTLQAFIKNSLERMAFEGSRGHKSIVEDPHFIQMKQYLKVCLTLENPKVEEIIRILGGQFDASPNSRVILFTRYRDTVKVILTRLEKTKGINAARFVGQGFREADPGMTQEEQHTRLEKLRSGELNVLVATSIAEEGLDIPEVDHVVFYEPVPSEIRYIQRRGRTGRKVAGKVTILIAENTLDEAFYWSSLKRARKMKMVIKQLNKKLPLMLEKRFRSTLTSTQTILWPQKKPCSTDDDYAKTKSHSRSIQSLELWTPQTLQTKGSSQALAWLMHNLPEKPTPVNALVERAFAETEIQKEAIETAIWKLILQGQLYRPEPGKILKL